MIYVYDGTWSGMMTLVLRTAREGAPEDIARSSGGSPLLDFTPVATDPDLAMAASSVLSGRLGGRAMRDAYLALSTEAPGIDLAVWLYLERIWREGKRAGGNLADGCVGKVFHAARAAAREYDHWLGWTRFQGVEGAYYASIGPTCDLLPLLAGHFSRRLPDRWVLHDTRRGKAAFHSEGRWMILEDVPSAALSCLTPEERDLQALWREFFQNTAIPERTNPRCQMNFLPRRMWRYLVENPER